MVRLLWGKLGSLQAVSCPARTQSIGVDHCLADAAWLLGQSLFFHSISMVTLGKSRGDGAWCFGWLGSVDAFV